MSWRLNQELRAAKLAGQLPHLEFTEFAVLLILTDTCRSESRVASISMAELEKLSGQTRVQMWRDIKRLIALGLLERVGGRGNQYQANRYKILLPDAGFIDETSTGSGDPDAGFTDVTSKPSDKKVLVTSDEVLVTSEASAGYIAMKPIPVPGNNPGERGGGTVQDFRPVAAVPDQGDALSLSNGFHQNNGEVLGELVDRDPNEGKPSFIKIGDRWFPEYCSAHMPDGYDGECKRCGITRLNNERRQERAMEARIAEMVASTPRPPPRPPRQLEIEDVVPKPDPDSPVCAADGCDKPATVDGLCGRCAIYRPPERHLIAGDSTGNGDLAATTAIKKREAAAA
jgi:hypothetical protein